MGGFEGVKKTKKELYDYIESTSGTVFVNADDAITMELSAALKNKIYFGSNAESLLSGRIESLEPMLCVAITFKKSAQTHIVQTQLVGDYNLANILAAACIGEYFKVPEQDIVAAIAGYTPTNNRSQIMHTNHNQLIMDAYNANPSSMFAAVNNFQHLAAPNKYLILGDMFELGEESIAEHQAIVLLVAELKFEKHIKVDEFASILKTWLGTVLATEEQVSPKSEVVEEVKAVEAKVVEEVKAVETAVVEEVKPAKAKKVKAA
jgi:UDP-N-acetylmuramoyl-tripeptide--D-alanyl-D-alanine ligase